MPAEDRTPIGIAALAALIVLLGLAAPAHAAATRAAARPDVAVGRVSAPRTVPARTSFDVAVTVLERSRRAAAHASLVVSAGGRAVTTMDVQIRAGGRTRVVVPVTLPMAGRFALAVHARVARDAATGNNAGRTAVAATDFTVAPASVLVDSFAGFGAQFNDRVYAALSRDAGVVDENVGDMEGKVVALAPGLVRVFFNRAAFSNPDRMQSFRRTADLAQRSGATIVVAWQTSANSNADIDMPRFADVLTDLVVNRGVTSLRWASVQNEVNSTKITFEQYDRMVRLLDARLRQNGVRDRVLIMGGDLVSTAQDEWLHSMGERESDVVDAYGIHVYWDYWAPDKLARRLTEVRQIVDGMPEEARKPLYVTEFGARGRRSPGDGGPGGWDDGTPLGNTNVNAFQHAWLDVLAARLGYAGTVKWDAYFGRYDAMPQAYTMIGPPQEGWPLRSVYHATRLFTETTRPGWKVVGVDGASGTRLVTALAGPSGELTLLGLDTAGASLNAPSTRVSTYTISGLPPGATFRLRLWNADGAGTLGGPLSVSADAAGVVRIGAPLQCVFALTTLPL